MKTFEATTTSQIINQSEWAEDRNTRFLLIQNKGSHPVCVWINKATVTMSGAESDPLIPAGGSWNLWAEDIEKIAIIAANTTECTIQPN